jgi:hypothetical protein
MRTRLIISVLILAPLALAGCVDLNADIRVNPDATASGSITMAVGNEAAGFLGIGSADDLAQAVQEEEMPGAVSPLAGADCAPAEVPNAIAVTCTFTDAEFTEEGGLWQLQRIDDSIIMTVTQAGDALTAADAGAEMLGGDMNIGSLEITARFPGPITTIEGENATKVDEFTVTVASSLTDSYTTTITAEAGSSGTPLWVFIVVGAAALITALILFILLRTTSKKQPLAIEPPKPAAIEAGSSNEISER